MRRSHVFERSAPRRREAPRAASEAAGGAPRGGPSAAQARRAEAEEGIDALVGACFASDAEDDPRVTAAVLGLRRTLGLA